MTPTLKQMFEHLFHTSPSFPCTILLCAALLFTQYSVLSTDLSSRRVLAASQPETAGVPPVPATFENISGGGGKYPSRLCVKSLVVVFAES
jgi:hypothetical protein